MLARALRIPLRISDKRAVALTFDDGPHPSGTPAVLDLLEARDASATFFLVGEQVERWPRVAVDIVARGHEIALHGHRHRLLLRTTSRSLADDLNRAAAVIADTTGQEPLYYRPPYGVFSSGALSLVSRCGWRPILWSRWGWDWSLHPPEAIARRSASGVRAGDVLLLHDADHYSASGSWRNTVAALPSVLDMIGASGLSCIRLRDAT